MAEVVYRSTQHLTAPDLRAMAVFLKSLPPAATVDRPVALPTSAGNMARGDALYRQHCLSCHGAQGQGQGSLYPALAGNRMVLMAQPVNLVRAIAQGGFGPATPGRPRPFGMPPFAQQLSDADIALLATYVRQRWGDPASAVAPQDVSRYRFGGNE